MCLIIVLYVLIEINIYLFELRFVFEYLLVNGMLKYTINTYLLQMDRWSPLLPPKNLLFLLSYREIYIFRTTLGFFQEGSMRDQMPL